MNPWTFYDFLDLSGSNVIRAWLDTIPPKASAKIDVRILYMRMVAVWPEQYVSSLEGWPSLVELRITSHGNQYRPLGFYGPYRRAFTLVLGAIEKGKLPRRVLELADERRGIILSDRSRIREHEFNRTNISESG